MIRLLSVKASSRCILTLFLVSILTACSDNKDSPVLRIGTNVWPGYEPLYLADSLGFFAENQVHLVEYSSASQVERAFRNNLIDAAGLTLDEVLLLAQYDFEPK